MSALSALVQLAGPALAPPVHQIAHLPVELAALLGQRNGFYAFDQALHVLPASVVDPLAPWNDPRRWQSEYGDLATGLLFFAHDVFGNSFAFQGDKIVLFNAETGDIEEVASNLEGWAHAILHDDYWTGRALAHTWQRQHGPLRPGQRLVPTRLFVLGGTIDFANLHARDAVESLKFRGYVAQKIRDLPDGAQIRFKITD